MYYEAMRNIHPVSADDYYRTHFQKLIDAKWYETTTVTKVEEETPFASLQFEEVEVRLQHVLDLARSRTQGDDFRQITFQNIEKRVRLGTYYRFSDAYWVTVNTDNYDRINKNIILKRCNNTIKWVDKEGWLHQYPCNLAYDQSSGSPQVDHDIITPNNKIQVILQANEHTLKLKANMRFIFGDRPFRVISINNYMIDTIDGDQSIIYMQVQLTEKLPKDDFVNCVADNYEILHGTIENPDDPLNPPPPEPPEPVPPKNGICMVPSFDTLRQNYVVEFDASIYAGDVKQAGVVTATCNGAPEWGYELESLGDNKFKLKCKKPTKIPLEITFTGGGQTKTYLIDLVSMFEGV